MSSITLQIKGMTCSSCVKKVETAVGQVAGVQSVTVNLLTEKGVVVFDEEKTSSDEIIAAIKNGPGYEATVVASNLNKRRKKKGPVVNVATLSVDGMTCASCVKKVETALLGVNGVESAEVSLLTERATVVFHPEQTSTDALVDAIKQGPGYTATLIQLSKKTQSALALVVDSGKKLKHSLFQLDGLNCQSCVNKISAAVQAISGVERQTVVVTMLPTAKLELTFDANETSNDEIISVVVGAGYKASLINTQNAKTVQSNKHSQNAEELGDEEEESIKMLFLKSDNMEKLCLDLLTFDAVEEAKVTTMDDNETLMIRLTFDSQMVGIRQLVDRLTPKHGPIEVYDQMSVAANSEAVEARQRKEKRHLLWHLLFAATFSIPVLILGVVLEYIPSTAAKVDQNAIGNMSIVDLTTWILATPVQFYSGWRFYVDSYHSMKTCSLGMSFLIALGTSVAYFYSVFAVLYNALANPSSKLTQAFDTSSLLITFVILGKFLEAVSKAKTTGALNALAKLAPDTATILEGDSERTIPLVLLEKGDIVVVRPGEKVPADGVIVKGEASLDESMLTGESVPVHKQPGDKIIGATIDIDGFIHFKATSVGSDTTLSQICQLVESAQSSKAPIQALADKISSIFVPIVLVVASLTFIIWAAILETGSYYTQGLGNIPYALLFAISALVVACPCALGLATPTAVMVGTGIGAKHGILIKGGGRTLGDARNITAVVFDKTGTLTMGAPTVEEILLLSDELFDEKQKHSMHTVTPEDGDSVSRIYSNILFRVLQFAATAERGSEHPLAKGIVAKADDEEIDSSGEVQNFTNEAGLGIKCVIDNRKINIGNRRSLQANNIDIRPGTFQAMDHLEAKGCTAVVLSVDGKTEAVIGLIDMPKPESSAAIATLRDQLGIKVYMLTGDNTRTARVVAKQIGLSEEHVFADVLPDEKADCIEKLQNQGEKVAMVGDGVNDSPALATSDLGIAIGAGADVAIEAAGVVLINSKPTDVIVALHLARATYRRIMINFGWALAYNITLIPIAAGVLYPLIHYQIPPYLASLAMAFSSVSVILSSLWLNLYKPPKLAHSKIKGGNMMSTNEPKSVQQSSFANSKQAQIYPGCHKAWDQPCSCKDQCLCSNCK